MPRAPVSNASLFAGAEFPLLPFLAPRVFVESPVSTKFRRDHGGKSNGQRKEQGRGKQQENLRAQQEKSCARAGPGDGGHGLPIQSSSPSRLQRRPTQVGACSSSPHPTSDINRRYIGISVFARQHLRPYSTSTTDDGAIAAQRVKPIDKPGTAVRRLTNPRSSRREKLLNDVTKQLAKYKKDRPRLTPDLLFKHGIYRSLRRRATNLRQHGATRADLTRLGKLENYQDGLIEAFAALERATYLNMKQNTTRINIKHHHLCAHFSSLVFGGDARHETQQAWNNWMALDAVTRKNAFRPLLLYLLDRKPGRAMHFIHIIANDSLLHDWNSELIADALGYLSEIHMNAEYGLVEDWDGDAVTVKRNFVPGFTHAYQKALAHQRNVCGQGLLYNLAQLSEIQDLKKVVDCFFEHKTHVGFDTTLHYANTFAEAGEITYSIRCLQNLKNSGPARFQTLMADRERLRWTCALILRKSMSINQDYHETPKMVADIVNLGVRLDTKLYNVVMNNAMEAGDYATAFKVYNNLEENQLTPAPETYSILLHGCTLQDNPAMFSQFAEHCANIAFESKNSWLAGDYIYYLYILHQSDEDKSKQLRLLRDAYVRYFDPATLEALGDSGLQTALPKHGGADHQEPSSNGRLGLEPTNFVLKIMLRAEIEAAQVRSNHEIEYLYQRFKTLIQQDEHKMLSNVARDSITWNAFLDAFCEKAQFASASQVIKDMAATTQPEIHSWNILMHAFAKRGQIQAADRVFELMHSRGIDPSQVSYNILLKGYARKQLTERVTEVMQHVDLDKAMRPDVLSQLTRMTNRRELMRNLEKIQQRKEAMEQEQAEIRTREDKLRWEPPLRLSDIKKDPVAFQERSNRLDQVSPVLEPEPDMYGFLNPAPGVSDPNIQPFSDDSRRGSTKPTGEDDGLAHDASPSTTDGSAPTASPGTESELLNVQPASVVSRKLPKFSARKVLSTRPRRVWN